MGMCNKINCNMYSFTVIILISGTKTKKNVIILFMSQKGVKKPNSILDGMFFRQPIEGVSE